MIKRGWIFVLTFFWILCFSGMAGAELLVIGTASYEGNDYKLIYDDDQELMWLDYTFPLNSWPKQTQTVNELNNPTVITYTFNPEISVQWTGAWRLPVAFNGSRKFGFDGATTAGFNITTSEIGHLYYESLGNLGYYDTNGTPQPGWGKLKQSEETWGLRNTGPFDNLVISNYWTGTEYIANPDHPWDFNMYSGAQDCTAFKDSYHFAGIAVRPAVIDGL